MNKAPVQLSAVSLFSGGGGLDLGIEAVGFRTLFATDIDSACYQTLVTNQLHAAKLGKPFLKNAEIVQSCVRDLSADEILDSINLKRGAVDLLVGGPPCQSFSVIGRRNGRNDPRGELIDEYLRLLGDIQPRAFLFENVKGFRSIDDGKLYTSILEQMRNPAYGLHYTLSRFCLNASNYGVPQNRERIFIIGSNQGHKIEYIPEITGEDSVSSGSGVTKKTVRDGLRNLPQAQSNYPSNHSGRVHSKRISDRYQNLKPGERDPKTRINKLDMEKPSFTIVSGSVRSGGKGHIHPTEPREVTPRESARLQTFPDWWEFQGTSVCDSRRQIGNAVPPLMAAAISNRIRSEMFGRAGVEFGCIVEILDQSHLQFNMACLR